MKLVPISCSPVALVVASLVAFVSACGESSSKPPRVATLETDSSVGEMRDVSAIHRSRCGNCHVRVEPGARTRAQFTDALSRHHKRVRMNDREWASMIDYLAADGGGQKVSKR